MPVLILLTGAALFTELEFRLQLQSLHQTLLIFFGVGVGTGAGIAITSRLFRELWK